MFTELESAVKDSSWCLVGCFRYSGFRHKSMFVFEEGGATAQEGVAT
jgi:hypothetical protein